MSVPKSSESESRCLHRLLQVHASSHDEPQPERKADAFRNISFELQIAQLKQLDNDRHAQSFLAARTFQEQYENIVDCLDTNCGLNNYAAGALALCGKNRNESEMWTSSLSKETIGNLDCVKKFLAGCEAEGKKQSTTDLSAPLWPSLAASCSSGSATTNDAINNISHRTTIDNAHRTTNDGIHRSTSDSTHRSTNDSTHRSTNDSTHRSTNDNTHRSTSDSTHRATHDSTNRALENANSTHRPLFKPQTQVNQRDQTGVFGNVGRESSFSWTSCGQSDSGFNSSHAAPEYQRPAPAFSAFGRGGKRQFELDDGDDQDGGPNGGRQVPSAFKTAKEQLVIEQNKKYGGGAGQSAPGFSYGSSKKSLGTRRGPNSRFVPPVLNRDESDAGSGYSSSRGNGSAGGSGKSDAEPVDERLKGLEPKIVELITNEIMDHRPQMDWDDIAGLQFAKKTIKEIVVWPMLRPDIFTGLRGPPKGLLLFGPPGTGKTLIGKCIASQSKSTFFCISASSLTSKWVGEGEKMVRALFAVARCHQPAVIFIDEVDSLLSQRSDGEHEASRRIKTEFLVQLDGATTDSEDRILVIGATNRPQEIDEAARRRFVKRLYIPLPEQVAREHIVRRLMAKQKCQLTETDVVTIASKTEGYSGADMANLCREAALGPIRSIPFEQMEYIRPEQVPPITMKDFEDALPQVRPSVSDKDLDVYITWNNTYGSFGQ